MRPPRKLSVEQLEFRRLLAINPSAVEQEFMQLTNRFRTDPVGEFSRLISVASPIQARDPIFQLELDTFGVNGTTLRNEFQQLSAVPPLAWSDGTNQFAASHNANLVAARQQFHSDGATRRQQLIANGVDLRLANGESVSSENVYGFAKSALHLFAGYIVDWGTGPAGMQTNRPHRASIINSDFDQAGTKVSSVTGAGFGPLVNTHVLVNIEDPKPMVVGAVFEDENASTWYEAGEGIGGVSIVFTGATGTFTTNTFSAGGYQIELPAGTYTATATGAGLSHAVTLNNIVVGNSNVWKNLIYDPDAILPDASEPNNATNTATELSGRDQSLNGRSIHIAADIDFYRFQPKSTGQATIRMQFSNAAGNLDMQLLNASGSVIATASTTGNTETITAQVTRDATYYIRAYSVGGGVNGSYTLSLDAPEPIAGVANSDRASVSNESPATVVNILANDSDADGDRSKLVPQLASNAPASFNVDSQNRLSYSAPAGFSGIERTTYTVVDDQGLVSNPATIEIFVINFAAPQPWTNSRNAVDVNGDNLVTGLDALLIINEINANAARQLPTTGDIRGLFGFLDTSGNGFISGLDVLQVVNAINNAASNNLVGEGENLATTRIQDEALEQLMAAGAVAEMNSKRNRFYNWGFE
jgi:uncharacterized protein YkwD